MWIFKTFLRDGVQVDFFQAGNGFMMVAKSTSRKDVNEVPLEQQENIQIKGSHARNVMMQKLHRKSEVTMWRCASVCTGWSKIQYVVTLQPLGIE